MKISNETKVGIFAAFGITVLILGYNFMRGKDLFTRTNTYYVNYSSVEGLSTSNPVLVNGYKVGQVTSIEMIQEDSVYFLVELEVKKDVLVPKNSFAKIYNLDFFGAKAVELVKSNETILADDGEILRPDVEPALINTVSKIVAPMKERFESILISLDSTLGVINPQHIKNSLQNLDKTIANVERMTAHLSETSMQKIDLILSDVQSISSNLKNNNEAINLTINNLKNFSDSLKASEIKATVAQANAALTSFNMMMQKINNGEGTLGQLVNNKEMYENLNKSSAALDALLKDLKANPKRYVHFSIFGRKK